MRKVCVLVCACVCVCVCVCMRASHNTREVFMVFLSLFYYKLVQVKQGVHSGRSQQDQWLLEGYQRQDKTGHALRSVHFILSASYSSALWLKSAAIVSASVSLRCVVWKRWCSSSSDCSLTSNNGDGLPLNSCSSHTETYHIPMRLIARRSSSSKGPALVCATRGTWSPIPRGLYSR